MLHDTNVHKFLSTSNLYLRLVNVNLINSIYLLHRLTMTNLKYQLEVLKNKGNPKNAMLVQKRKLEHRCAFLAHVPIY